VPKVHKKPIKRPRKGSNKESKRHPKRHPALAHWTVRCATGQCPVHQGTQRWTCHLWENGRPLRYNSSDCPVKHRTVSGVTPDSVRCHTGLSGVPAEQLLFRAQRSTTTHLMRACTRRGQSTRSWRTRQSTGPVRCTTGQPQGPTSQSSNGRTPTAVWHGWRTVQCPVAHRTVRCAMRQQPSNGHILVVGAINTPTTPHSMASKFSIFNTLQEL
jgi:hypothetical protein